MHTYEHNIYIYIYYILHEYTYIYVYMYNTQTIYKDIYTYVYMYIYIYVDIYIYIHIHLYIYIYVYTYIQMQTCTYVRQLNILLTEPSKRNPAGHGVPWISPELLRFTPRELAKMAYSLAKLRPPPTEGPKDQMKIGILIWYILW